VKDYSDIRTLIYDYPNKNVNEEVPKKKRYGVADAKALMARLLPIMNALGWIKIITQLIYYYKYPRFSEAVKWYLVLLAYFWKPEFLLTYIVLFFIILFVYLSEGFKKYCHPVVVGYFTGRLHPNYNIEPKVKILTKRSLDAKNRSMKDEEEDDSIYSIQNQLGKYKKLMSNISVLFFAVEFLINLFEKVKNLLIWKNKKATKLFFFCLLMILIAFTYLPIRYLIIILVLRKFSKGKRFWGRCYKSNRLIGTIELKTFLSKDIGIQISDFNDPWPTLKGLEKKLQGYF